MRYSNKHLKEAYGKIAFIGKNNCESALRFRSDKDVEMYTDQARKEGLLALISEFGELLLSNAQIATFRGDILIDGQNTCYQVL